MGLAAGRRGAAALRRRAQSSLHWPRRLGRDRRAPAASGRLDRPGAADRVARGLLPIEDRAMPSQLPPPGAVFLDHVAHFVPEMDAAAAALELCGFRLTPFTAQANRVDGAVVPTGTGNRCVMLRRGYVEVLTAIPTVAGETDLARQLRERIGDHVGLHLAAFSSADTAAEHRRLAVLGFPTLPLVEMRRPVKTAVGSEDARFTIARVTPGSMAEGRVQFLTHHTEPLVWRPDFLDHPNGAQALTGLWIGSTDPAGPGGSFARFTGRPSLRGGAGTT